MSGVRDPSQDWSSLSAYSLQKYSGQRGERRKEDAADLGVEGGGATTSVDFE